MENASKALIIAGAILVAILLISIGVIVINSTGNMQDQVQTSSDSMAIETFNSQFTIYEGTGITASQVRGLISKINASNAKNTNHQVTVNGSGTSFTTSAGSTYTVSLEYTNGYVSNAKIN